MSWLDPFFTTPAPVFINAVADAGATGNGVTDDAGAIRAALARLALAGGELYFPEGSYKIASRLVATVSPGKHVLIRAHGNATFLASSVPEPGALGGIIDLTGGADTSVTLVDLFIQSAAVVVGLLNGFMLRSFGNVEVSGCGAVGCSYIGMYVKECLAGTIDNSDFSGSRYAGCALEASSGVKVTSSVAHDCGTTVPDDGYGFTCITSVIGPNSDCEFSGCQADRCKRKAFDVHSGHRIKFSKCSATGFGFAGFYAVGEDGNKDVADCSFDDCYADGLSGIVDPNNPSTPQVIYGFNVGAFSALAPESGSFTITNPRVKNCDGAAGSMSFLIDVAQGTSAQVTGGGAAEDFAGITNGKTLILAIDGQQQVTTTFVVPGDTTASAVAARINAALQAAYGKGLGGSVASVSGGHLRLTSPDAGPRSIVQVVGGDGRVKCGLFVGTTNGASATVEGGSGGSENLASVANGETLIVAIDGLANVTTTFVVPGDTTADAIVSRINTAILAAYGGIYTDVAVNDGGHVRLISPLIRSASKVNIVGGSARSKLGYNTGLTTGSGGYSPDVVQITKGSTNKGCHTGTSLCHVTNYQVMIGKLIIDGVAMHSEGALNGINTSGVVRETKVTNLPFTFESGTVTNGVYLGNNPGHVSGVSFHGLAAVTNKIPQTDRLSQSIFANRFKGAPVADDVRRFANSADLGKVTQMGSFDLTLTSGTSENDSTIPGGFPLPFSAAPHMKALLVIKTGNGIPNTNMPTMRVGEGYPTSANCQFIVTTPSALAANLAVTVHWEATGLLA